MKEYLGSVEQVDGYVLIVNSYMLRTLDFLDNLISINGDTLWKLGYSPVIRLLYSDSIVDLSIILQKFLLWTSRSQQPESKVCQMESTGKAAAWRTYRCESASGT